MVDLRAKEECRNGLGLPHHFRIGWHEDPPKCSDCDLHRHRFGRSDMAILGSLDNLVVLGSLDYLAVLGTLDQPAPASPTPMGTRLWRPMSCKIHTLGCARGFAFVVNMPLGFRMMPTLLFSTH